MSETEQHLNDESRNEEPQNVERQNEEPQNIIIATIKDYLNGITAGIFGPFMTCGKNRPKKLGGAIFHLVYTLITGWLCFALIFVRRYSITEFLTRDPLAPTYVFGIKTNIGFMLASFAFILGVMVVLPVLTQAVIQKFILKQEPDYRDIVIQAAYSGPSFSLIASLPVIWFTLDWTIDLFFWANVDSSLKFYWFLWATMAWSFLCYTWNISKTSRVPLYYTLIHMWVPIVLLIVGRFVIVL